MRIEADRLGRGLILDEERQSEMSVVRNEYEIGENNPYRALRKATVAAAIQAHPYHWNTIGYRSDIEGVSTEKLRQHYRTYFPPDNAEAILVGDFDAETALTLFDRRLGAFPSGERPAFTAVVRSQPAERGAREAVTLRGEANMNIVMGAASGLRRLDPDYEAALVANAALGQTALASRIGRCVRDTGGLTYQIYSRFLQSDELDGLCLVNVNVAPQNLARALKSTREELEKYAREGAADAEIAAQKSFFAGNYNVNLGSNAGIAAAEKFDFGPAHLDRFPARIAAVTTAEANAAMRRHFFPDRLHPIVAGDLEALPD